MPVVVVVEEAGGNRPAPDGYSRLFSDIGEGAVAVVVIEDVLSVVGDVQVGIPVVVVVTHGDAHAVVAVSHTGETRCFRDVGEATVTVLAKQAVPITGVAAVEVRRSLHGVGQASAVY